jgi:hypothetical protein
MLIPATYRKMVLVESPRSDCVEPGGTPIRRYRLARLRLDSRSDTEPRYEYLKRVYD